MKEKFKLYGSVFILIVFVPYLLTVYLHGGSGGFLARRTGDAQLEEAVTAVLAEEIPASCETECLKAQAVIVRTNLYREREAAGEDTGGGEISGEDTGGGGSSGEAAADAGAGEEAARGERADDEPGWSEEEMRLAWGEEHFEQNLERIKNAAAATEGEILTFDGEPIAAAYHAASNKRTRSAAEVPGQEAYTYLAGVDSEEDILADGFLYIGYMEKQQFAEALQGVFDGEELAADQLPGALEITERDSADYVTKVTYGNTVVNGEAVRDALNLNSACFYFSELEGRIRIVTKGIGHGLGFSQYGANERAKQGEDYRELLHYYYKDVEIEKI